MANDEAPGRLSASLLVDSGDPALQDIAVYAVRGREAISEPFRYEVDFRAQALSPTEARGASVELVLADEAGHELRIGGRVARITASLVPAEGGQGRVPYRLLIVPEAYLSLHTRRGFRIFQELSVVDIAKALCDASGVDRAAFAWDKLEANYKPRPYCVQYDETEWDFLCRILEEEGIFFSFDYREGGTVMVFSDHVLRTKKVAWEELEFSYGPRFTTVTPQIWQWHEAARLGSSKVLLDDYDQADPRRDLRAEAEVAQHPDRLWYEFPGGYSETADATRLARVRLHERQRRRRTARAQTSALDLRAGQRFKVLHHPTADPQYLVQEITLDARVEEQKGAGPLVIEGPTSFERNLAALPTDAHYRPPRRARKPRVMGLQTARVTGPAGAEIHCDPLGRVKLQFHWDRQGQLDDHTSCWVRVSQLHTTGSVAIPRVGWEVIVEFEGGDPDRPVCMGRLFNPFFAPPVVLPDAKTETHHGSLSSPGGGGVNQVSLDDTAGGEIMRIAGHRDLVLLAAHNKTFNVGGDMGHRVGANRKAEVVGNETVEIQGNLSAHVGATQKIKVGLREVKVGGSASEDVVSDLTITIGGAEMIQVGDPSQAVLDTVKSMALEAAQGAAAGLMHQAQAALLAPLAPVLSRARAALGPAGAAKAGPAAALLGPGAGSGAELAMFGGAPSALAKAGGAGDAGLLAAGFAQAAADGAVVARGLDGAGAGGGGGGGGAGGPAGPTGGGSGVYSVIVGGNVTETVGGLAARNSLKGLSFAIGGNSMETIGAVRVEAIAGGKNETTGKAKAETVGTYIADIKTGLSVSAQAGIGINIGGAQRQNISGSHSLSSDGPVKITAPKLKIEGSGTITLKCGACKVVITSGGIDIEGASKVTIEGQTISLNENAIG